MNTHNEQNPNRLIIEGYALNVASAGALKYNIEVTNNTGAEGPLKYAVGSSDGTYQDVQNDTITVDLYDLLDGSQTYYFKTNDTNATPYVVHFDWSTVVMTKCTTIYQEVGNITIQKAKDYLADMPKTLTFVGADENTYDLAVTWPDGDCIDDAGEWIFAPEIKLREYIDCSGDLYDGLRITLNVVADNEG